MKEAGFSAYFTKPIRHSVFRDGLAIVLGKRDGGQMNAEDAALVTCHTVTESQKSKVRILLAEIMWSTSAWPRGFCSSAAIEGHREQRTRSGGGRPERRLRSGSHGLQMPVMDGYEATREIRRRESGDRHTPVVAMTATPCGAIARNASRRAWMTMFRSRSSRPTFSPRSKRCAKRTVPNG